MANDPVLHLLGLAKKAGRLEIGEEPVGAVCRAHHARLVLLAADAAPNTRRRAAHFGEAGNVLFLELPFTKAELGFTLGRSSCAMLALTDAGFAASILEKLAARDDRYGPAALQLREKADRMLQRQREKRQHEKNLREGKRKPWAPPPPPPKAPEERRKPVSPAAPTKTQRKPKPPVQGGSAHFAKDGPAHSGRPQKPGPGGRRLSGKFRHNP